MCVPPWRLFETSGRILCAAFEPSVKSDKLPETDWEADFVQNSFTDSTTLKFIIRILLWIVILVFNLFLSFVFIRA